MGTGLMSADESRVFAALGAIQSELATLREDFKEQEEKTTTEHRKVHDIVVATNEAIRNLTRDVAEMKPLVDAYRLKAASLDEAVELAEDYRERRAEDRGAEKFKKWLYGLAASVGGLIAVLASKLLDWLMTRPHIPA